MCLSLCALEQRERSNREVSNRGLTVGFLQERRWGAKALGRGAEHPFGS